MHFSTFFPLLFLLLAPSFGLNLDGTLLLSFKYSILSDPLSVLENWDYNDDTPCLWTGVKCAQVETTLNELRVISLTLPNSQLVGSIPEDLGFIQHLQTLDLSSNFLNGTLPSSLFNASEIQTLSLSNNGITGSIPDFISGPKNLKVLNLSVNALVGNIPNSLASMNKLTVVSLSHNFFTGPVLSRIQSFEVLDLSSNLLNGSLPIEFGGDNLKYLNISSNKLSGTVPPEFASKIPKTATIDLSFNDLSGEIPETEPFSNQNKEYYQGNIDLCGKPTKKLCTVPSTFSSPPNISTNSSPAAIAAIPKTIGSTPLPDSSVTTTTTNSPSHVQSTHGLKPAAIAGIAVGNLAGVGALAAIVFFVYQKKKKRASPTTKEPVFSTVNEYKFDNDQELKTVKETKTLPTWHCLSIRNGGESSDSTGSETDHETNEKQTDTKIHIHEESKKERSLVMVDGETDIEFETLFKASAYVLGSAGGSIVYKAVLQDGTEFAVRRIGESAIEKLKEFENHVRTIAKIRHENLVRVRGFYWGDDEKLVIYDYVSNGSLASNGCYRKVGSSPYHMPFGTRLKIAKGVARGLSYIHDKKNVHGNIKPSNILLTADMEPIISDFGLHLLIYGKNNRKGDDSRHFGSKRSCNDLHDQSVNTSPYAGPAGFMGCTSPYHAPESLKNLKPSSKWDVYSFGILLLELLTGKVFSDRELGNWTIDLVVDDPSQALRMVDVSIRGDVSGREDAVLAWFKLGLSCASLSPHKRPSMKDAVHVLEKMPLSSHYYSTN